MFVRVHPSTVLEPVDEARHGALYPGVRVESFKCGLYATEKRSLDKKTKKELFLKSVFRGTNERCHGVAAQSIAQEIVLIGTARAAM